MRREPIKDRLRSSSMLKILSPIGLKDASHHEFHSFKKKNSAENLRECRSHSFSI